MAHWRLLGNSHTTYIDEYELSIRELETQYHVVFDYLYWDYLIPKNASVDQVKEHTLQEIKRNITERLEQLHNVLRDMG